MNNLVKTGKIALLLISLSFYVPIVILIIFSVLDSNKYSAPLEILFNVALISWPVQIVIYLICVFKNKSFKRDKKFLWGYLMLTTAPLLSCIYWYLFIWRSPKSSDVEDIIVTNIYHIGKREIKKSCKYLLLLFSLLPCIFTVAALLLVVLTEPTNPFATTLVIPFGVFTLGMLTFYIYNIYHNELVDRNSRALWTIMLLFGNVVLFPFYWYFLIWREPKNGNSDL